MKKHGRVKLIEKRLFEKSFESIKSGDRLKKILSAIVQNNPWEPAED